MVDLFWIYEEKVVLDCLLHILQLQKEILMTMGWDQLFPYLKDKLVIDAIKTNGLKNSLPY